MRLILLRTVSTIIAGSCSLLCAQEAGNDRSFDVTITETDSTLQIVTPQLEASVNKQGYVTGIQRQTFVDRATGFRDAGFGLDIADWIMQPG
ncbi:MAG: hypothetical protein KDA96_29190, partial [Planctomycetaceae bacterium]|nr:hypothetical protein [Planctomycetaceae bacterium]